MPNNDTTVQQATSTEEKKVDISVEGDKAIIRMSSYADGIGWFTQKTITVDADLLDGLCSMLSDARGKIRRDSDEILSAEILEF